MIRYFFLIFVGIILGGCSLFQADNSGSAKENQSDVNLKVTKHTLENGLRVIVYENHRLPIFSYYTFFEIGSRFERHGTTGATHFLEHMMFKGAKKYGAGEFNSAIQSSGGFSNAYTSFDATVYHQSVPTHMLEKVVDLEADRFKHLLLDPKLLEKERQVVIEERRMRLENRPASKLGARVLAEMFEGTPYETPVIGIRKDIETVSASKLRSFFQRYYTPNNAVIVVAGDVDTKNVLGLIEKNFGMIPKSSELEGLKRKLDNPADFQFKGKYGGRMVNIKGTNPLPIFQYAFKARPLGGRESLVIDMVTTMLGYGASSYFHQKFVKGRKPFASYVHASNLSLKRNGIIYVGGHLTRKMRPAKIKKVLDREFRNACDNAINERSLQKTKNQYLGIFFSSISTNDGVANLLGESELKLNDYLIYKKDLDIYNSITVKEARRVCKKSLNPENSIFFSIWNKN